MKLTLMLGGLLLWATFACSQVKLQDFNDQRNVITRRGMEVLGSWGAANMIVSIVGITTTTGEAKYFHQMGLIWGSSNLLIAGITYAGLRRSRPPLSLEQSVKGQAAIEKSFLINGGLDLVYLSAGLFCLEKSKNQLNPNRYRGYGKSLFVQGGGLLLFDMIMYISHTRHGKALYNLLDKVQFSGNSAGILWKL